jgi:hypothetical protein
VSNYPGAIDNTASLYTPVDAFSTKPLETTTTGAVQADDSTINVASTSGGFAATYGILSVDDELIVYVGKTATQFTGCQRGAFGTVAANHTSGATVRANMVAGFITALQSAVLAIENELGTAAARNYVRKDGAVTITGIKTFQDGAEFGSGAKAGTGLVRLPNNGTIKWRKADNSGDLGMALNSANHLAMDAIIDFAPGQTFGSPTYPDATTSSKGTVQIDSVGGLAVDAGVVSLAGTGVSPGTYTKTTVDAKGRVTAGALLSAGDLPAHTHTASDIVSGALPFTIQNNGAPVGTRRAQPDRRQQHRPGIPGCAVERPRERHRGARLYPRAHARRGRRDESRRGFGGQGAALPHARASRRDRPYHGAGGQSANVPHAFRGRHYGLGN